MCVQYTSIILCGKMINIFLATFTSTVRDNLIHWSHINNQ